MRFFQASQEYINSKVTTVYVQYIYCMFKVQPSAVVVDQIRQGYTPVKIVCIRNE